MRIQYVSDLHLEFESFKNGNPVGDHFKIPMQDTDSDTVLVLAGDIGLVDKAYQIVPFVEELCERFYSVIYLLGNHEYYRASLVNAVDKLKDILAHTGVVILQNETVKIQDVNFVGCTLWSDYRGGNPLDMMDAQANMSDFSLIRTGTTEKPYMRKITPNDLLCEHATSVAYLEEQLYELKLVGLSEKVVVLTHYLPSWESIDPQFYGSNLNGAYYSNLEKLMAYYHPELWIHGHTHASCEYTMHDTKVRCNPRGYIGHADDLNVRFDPLKFEEV